VGGLANGHDWQFCSESYPRRSEPEPIRSSSFWTRKSTPTRLLLIVEVTALIHQCRNYYKISEPWRWEPGRGSLLTWRYSSLRVWPYSHRSLSSTFSLSYRSLPFFGLSEIIEDERDYPTLLVPDLYLSLAISSIFPRSFPGSHILVLPKNMVPFFSQQQFVL
jgi:hypothetical protein